MHSSRRSFTRRMFKLSPLLLVVTLTLHFPLSTYCHVCLTPPEATSTTTSTTASPAVTSNSPTTSTSTTTTTTTTAASVPSTASPRARDSPTTGVDDTNAFTHGKKVVCYYGSWAVYRPEKGKYPVELMDPYLCTHYIYTFAGLGYDNRIRSLDPWNDLKDNYGKGAFERFTGLKKINPRLKTLIAIGGWNEGSIKYSAMAADPNARSTFVKSTVDFLKLYNFDGLDLDWEYPSARGGKPEDKENFAALTRELRQAFNPHGFLLTAAVSAGKWFIDPGYDVPEISRNLDFINVMCYDYHGGWEDKTGHNAPMYARPDETGIDRISNVNYSINYWMEKGAPKEKLILGMGTYGRSFTLARAEVNGLGAPAPQKGQAGPYTREPGSLGYNEICVSLKRERWTIKNDPNHMAPYAYNDRQWVGYDDVDSIAIKTRFASAMDLGGAMIWSIETDDFLGECDGGKYPLLRTINRVFLEKSRPSIPTPPPNGDGGESTVPSSTTPAQPSSTEWWSSSSSTTQAPSSTWWPTSSSTQAPSSTWWPTSSSTQAPSSTEWWSSSSSTVTPSTTTTTTTTTSSPSTSTSTSSDSGSTPGIFWWKFGTESSRTSTTLRSLPTWPSTPSSWTTWTSTVSTTSAPVNSNGVTPPPRSDELSCTQAGSFRHPRDCRRYYQCVDNGAGRFIRHDYSCPVDTAYDENSRICIWAHSVSECNKKYPNDAPQSTSSSTTSTTTTRTPSTSDSSREETTSTSTTTVKARSNEVEREDAPVSSIADP